MGFWLRDHVVRQMAAGIDRARAECHAVCTEQHSGAYGAVRHNTGFPAADGDPNAKCRCAVPLRIWDLRGRFFCRSAHSIPFHSCSARADRSEARDSKTADQDLSLHWRGPIYPIFTDQAPLLVSLLFYAPGAGGIHNGTLPDPF